MYYCCSCSWRVETQLRSLLRIFTCYFLTFFVVLAELQRVSTILYWLVRGVVAVSSNSRRKNIISINPFLTLLHVTSYYY